MKISKTKKNQVVAALKDLGSKVELMESGPTVRFKKAAYFKAAKAIEGCSATTLDEILVLPGVGSSIQKKIKEILDTGELRKLKKFDDDFSGLLVIEGVGPVKAKSLHEQYGVRDAKGVMKLIKDGTIVDEKLRLNVQRALTLKNKRLPRKKIEEMADPVVLHLKVGCPQAIVQLAGSIRRLLATCKDIDILICGLPKVLEQARNVFLSYDWDLVTAEGTTRIDAIKDGIAVNGWFLPKECYGSGLLHCTGSGEFNQVLRGMAKRKGYKLSEYGLKDRETDEVLESWDEKKIFKLLGIKFIEPKDRNPEALR